MKNLLKLSLAGSLIGLLIIIFLANNLEPSLKTISDIDERNLEEVVRVQGQVTLVRNYETLTIFTIDDGTGKIDFVFYDNIEIQKNQTIEAIGKVTEYKGKIEIESSKIKILET